MRGKHNSSIQKQNFMSWVTPPLCSSPAMLSCSSVCCATTHSSTGTTRPFLLASRRGVLSTVSADYRCDLSLLTYSSNSSIRSLFKIETNSRCKNNRIEWELPDIITVSRVLWSIKLLCNWKVRLHLTQSRCFTHWIRDSMKHTIRSLSSTTTYNTNQSIFYFFYLWIFNIIISFMFSKHHLKIRPKW